MNTMLVKSVPVGDFEEVSIVAPNDKPYDFRALFLKLIQERKRIKYDVHTMPNLSKEIQDELSKQSYIHLILETDHDKHFLIPNLDFKKLAKDLADNLQIVQARKIRASLYQDGHLIAKGSVEVGDGRVIFFPSDPHVLENPLPKPISLKPSETSPEIHLSQSQIDFELSSQLIWFFDIA